MDKIFVSFSYRNDDQLVVRPMVEFVEAVLEAHGIRAITGEATGGEALTPAIMGRINECDALIAILTPNKKRDDGKSDPHPWVRDELNQARGQNKKCIALVRPDVAVEGAWQEHERIAWGQDDLLRVAKRLVQTVGQWKREGGRVVKVMLLPEALAFRIARNPEGAVCEYRLIQNTTGKATAWQATDVVGETAGTFVWINVVSEDSLLEVRVKLGRELWRSRVAPQFVHTKLQKGERP